MQAGLIKQVPWGSSAAVGTLMVLVLHHKVKLIYDARVPNVALAHKGLCVKLDPYWLPALMALVRSPAAGA